MSSKYLGASLPAFIDDELIKERTYWLQKLSSDLTIAGLPLDFERPAIFIDRKNRFQIEIEPETQKRLFEISRNRPTLVFVVLITALKICLYKYTGTEDVIIGTSIHEDFAEVASLNKTLALLDKVNDALTVKELLLNVKQTLDEAYEHQKYPFDRILDLLQVSPLPNCGSLFHVTITLANINNRENVRNLKTDVSLDFAIDGDRLSGEIEYNPGLFCRETIEKFDRHYRKALSQILSSPEARVSQISLLSTEEKHQLCYDFNSTFRDYPKTCVHELFAAQVRRTPEAIAVRYEQQELSYAELERRANQLGHYLQARGVKVETLVGICLERSLELMIGMLAVLKAGAAYVPLDPSYPEQRLRLMVEDAGVEVLLTEAEWAEKLGGGARQQMICLGLEWAEIGKESSGAVASGASAENLAYVIYTSGSTGRPKGVMISHHAVVNFLHSMSQQPGFTTHDVLLAVTTLSFDIAVLELFLPLVNGGRLVIVSREVTLDGRRLWDQLEQSGATMMQATPATWRLLLAAGWRAGGRLRILCGGEALSWDLANELVGNETELWNVYGPTETTIWSSMYRVEQPSTQDGIVSIGRPLANTELYVLDAALQMLPAGVAGELYIGGAGLARGYWQEAGQTADRFVPHPFSSQPGARLYRTGDVVHYLSDGNVRYLGRVDQQVKIRGFRIE